MNLRCSPEGLTLIKTAEGLRLAAYKDQRGLWTCGYGHRIGVTPNTTCTPEIADAWLLQDTQAVERYLNASLPPSVTQAQFSALVSFVFNIGIGEFIESTMFRLILDGDMLGAAQEFPRWDHVTVDGVKQEDPGLLERRLKEKALFLSGA